MSTTNPSSSGTTLRALARLLDYPDAVLRANLGALRAALHRDSPLTRARLEEIDLLIDSIERQEPLDAEADYVQLFDSGRRTALHVFEHVHGDSRERGPALIDLAQTYETAGLFLREGEMPDYLPVILEFASTQPAREARAFLAELAHILNAIFSALHKRHSRYASVLGALIELAGEKASAVDIPEEEPLDDTWTEPAAFDGCAGGGQSRPGQPQPVHFVRPAQARGART